MVAIASSAENFSAPDIEAFHGSVMPQSSQSCGDLAVVVVASMRWRLEQASFRGRSYGMPLLNQSEEGNKRWTKQINWNMYMNIQVDIGWIES
jgi:hypothetical protein